MVLVSIESVLADCQDVAERPFGCQTRPLGSLPQPDSWNASGNSQKRVDDQRVSKSSCHKEFVKSPQKYKKMVYLADFLFFEKL